MSHDPLSILFVTDVSENVIRIRETLEQTDLGKFRLDNLAVEIEELRLVARSHHDVCIVDCQREGQCMVSTLQRFGFTGPIIVVAPDSASQVLEAIHHGAADCLLRNNLTAQALEQSICAVIHRAQSLASLAQYERCYRGLMENSCEIIYTHDLEGNYTSINKTGEQVTGYAAHELVGMNIRQVLAPEYLPAARRVMSRMLANHKRGFFEAVLRTKDGKRVHVGVSIHLIYKEGSPIGVQGIARESLSVHSQMLGEAERFTPA